MENNKEKTSFGLNEWGVPENPPFDIIENNARWFEVIKNNVTELTKNQTTNKDFVEGYKNAPREDDYLDKYRAKLIGKQANRRLKLKCFFKRIFKFLIKK